MAMESPGLLRQVSCEIAQKKTAGAAGAAGAAETIYIYMGEPNWQMDMLYIYIIICIFVYIYVYTYLYIYIYIYNMVPFPLKTYLLSRFSAICGEGIVW